MESDAQAHLGFQIKTLSRLLSMHMDRQITSLGLTGSQGSVLGYLCRERGQPVRSRDVERQFGFSHPTVSGLLQRLEAKGFITCAPDREDRRCKRISPTEKALRLDEAVRAQIACTERALSAGMTPEELALLQNLLRRMIRNLTPSAEEGGISLDP